MSFDRDGGTLRSAGDVLDFLTATGAIENEDALRVRAQLKSPASASRFLAKALTLRDAVTAALRAIEARKPLGKEALGAINAMLASGSGFEQIERHGDGYRVDRRHVRDDPAIALVPIARDVARLLALPKAPVRTCAGEGCVRRFYDDSRTGRRRWCEMAVCGNRAKASAFARRQRESR